MNYVWIWLVAMLLSLGLGFLLGRALMLRKRRHMEQYVSEVMEQHLAEVQTMYSQVRGWRHDYRNHIQTMQAYVEMQAYDALAVYLRDLTDTVTLTDQVIKTGNIAMDAILNSKVSLARAQGIHVDISAVVPTGIVISDVDLCQMIGNLMDNAVEACLKIEKKEDRFLRVYIDVIKEQLYIYILNATQESPRRLGGHYLSSKGGRHGFGLQRVDQVIAKYGGYLERQDEPGVFATEILLPLAHK